MTAVRLPAGWACEPLREVAGIERNTISPEAIEPGTAYVGLEHISSDGSIIGVESVARGDLRSNKFRFTREHILYGKLRPYLQKIARPDFDGVCSTDILPLRPKPRIDGSYLRHFLRQPNMVELATRRSSGANLPRLSPKVLEEFPVSYPLHLDEQKRVAAILDAAEAIRRKHQQAIALTEDLLCSALLDICGDPLVNPRRWPMVELGELVRDSQYGTAEKANSDGRGRPVLRMNNITYFGKIDVSDLKHCTLSESDRRKYSLKRGDLLFNRTNSPELVGKTAVWDRDDEFLFAGYLIRFRFDESRVLPDYLASALNSPNGKRLLAQSAVPSNNMSNISAATFGRLRIATPQIDVQRRFVDVRRALNLAAPRIEEFAQESDALFESLSQRAFRGEL